MYKIEEGGEVHIPKIYSPYINQIGEGFRHQQQ